MEDAWLVCQAPSKDFSKEEVRKAMGCVGKVYKAKKWARRWANGRPVRKVKGGYKIMPRR